MMKEYVKMKYNKLIVSKVIKKSDILVVAMSDSKKMRKIIVNNKGYFTINCFYHDDKHPSMILYPENNFYCLSCKQGGNVISLFMKMHDMKFLESLETLAAAFDINLPKRSYIETNQELVVRLKEIRDSLKYKELIEKRKQKTLKNSID